MDNLYSANQELARVSKELLKKYDDLIALSKWRVDITDAIFDLLAWEADFTAYINKLPEPAPTQLSRVVRRFRILLTKGVERAESGNGQETVHEQRDSELVQQP